MFQIFKDKYKPQIEQLNNDIDTNYQNYLNNFKIVQDENENIIKECEAEINVIDSERHLMREEITNVYDFLKKFGEFENKITLFDFVNEGRIKSNIIQIRPKIEKINYEELDFLFEPLRKTTIKKKNNKNHLLEKEIDFQNEKIAQQNQINTIKDSIKTNILIKEIANMYRISIAAVRDAVKKISPYFYIAESFVIADKIKDYIINNEEINSITSNDYNIDLYSQTPYEQHYIFVRNTFDYYQFITTIYREPILGKIIEDSVVTDAERQNFINKLKEVENKSNNIIALVESECN